MNGPPCAPCPGGDMVGQTAPFVLHFPRNNISTFSRNGANCCAFAVRSMAHAAWLFTYRPSVFGRRSSFASYNVRQCLPLSKK